MTAIDPIRPSTPVAPIAVASTKSAAASEKPAVAGDTLALSKPGAEASARPAPKRSLLTSVGAFFRHLFVKDGIWHNPEAKPPTATPTGLDVMSYNVMVKTTHWEAVARDIEAAHPDVVNLQETSEATAKALAERLGMHLAWQEDPLHGYGGVAILSRYPITAYESRKLDAPLKERFGVMWEGLKAGNFGKFSALDARYALHAQLQVGDRTVDVLNGHLQLKGAKLNARQITEVTDWATDLEKSGHTVVVAGDWNTNMATFDRPGTVRDAPGTYVTPTDTYGEARARRPGTSMSNSSDPQDREALVRLFERFGYYWDAPDRTVRSGGESLTPDEALARLTSGKIALDSPEGKRLQAVVDGATLPSGYLRFDNLFASKDAHFESAHIDQTSQASDHYPVVARLSWK